MTLASAVRAILPRLVELCARRRLLVMLLSVLLAIGCVYVSSQRLGVTTDTSLLFARSLPWKQSSDALAAAFPQNDGLLVGVIDGRIPEEAEATASALTASLRTHPKLFTQVEQPDTSDYLQRNAFLLIDTKELQDLLDRTVDAQPFLGQLVADPSLRGLFAALSLVAEGASRGIDAASLRPAMAQFHTALAQAAAGHPAPLSWENLLAGPLAQQAGRFRFVTTKPVLDYNDLQPGGAAGTAMRAAAQALPYVANHDAHVRLTGSVALDDEEFASVAQGAAIGLGGSFVLVIVWLFAAVRSWRLTVPIALTLLMGLLLTTGFAALSVGTLNLISVAFAILFVGIAVDFAIQFTVRFRERRHVHPDPYDALRETGRNSGSQILVASLATASGFLAFTPTEFVGVAQLGIIAGGGMLIAFICTLTLLPALMITFKPRKEKREVGVMMLRRLEPIVRPLHWPILIVFVAAALVGAALTPSIPFDGDPLHTKNQHTEAVTTLNDLMNDPVTNPYTIEALLPSLPDAAAIAPKLYPLSTVQDVLSLNSFVPTDQPAKLAAIADAASLLLPTLTPPDHVPPVSAADIRAAAHALQTKLAAAITQLGPKLPADDPLRAIAGDLTQLETSTDANLLATNDALIRFLPVQLGRLRTALAAKPVTLADVPENLKRQWMLPDGRARIQVLPKSSVMDSHSIRHFVDQVTPVMPQATGSAVWIVRSAQTIIHAFSIAACCAMLAIAILLSVALQRVLDVALVMTPLLVSSLLTVVVVRSAGISLNFANIIALPLLLGVGVSFNIYFVMNWRSGITKFLGSATARAVIFSALTTGTAFGSLALSAHPGTASMGTLLLISLVCTVLTTLLFVPALLAVIPRPHVVLGGVAREDAIT
jgi:hopanoid biosynthesis associated RND transporter like protein HpnN